jgi:transposase
MRFLLRPGAALPKLPSTADTKGRLRASKEQRRIILGESERSGISAVQFAQQTGLKCSTFAAWVQRYRRTKRLVRKSPLRLLEAMAAQPAPAIAVRLQVQLPGSARLEISEAAASSVASRAGKTMLSFSGSLRVFVAAEPCDMRKGFNGLHAAVTKRLGEDPKGGALFVFCNRRYTRIKILCWDGTGLWVLTKRLEKGTFSWPKNLEPEGPSSS